MLLWLDRVLGRADGDSLSGALDLGGGGADGLGHAGAGGGVHRAAHRLSPLSALLSAKLNLVKISNQSRESHEKKTNGLLASLNSTEKANLFLPALGQLDLAANLLKLLPALLLLHLVFLSA